MPATDGIIIKDDTTEVNEIKALHVLIQTLCCTISSIQGAAEGLPIAIYELDGKEYGNAISEKDCTNIAISHLPGSVAIVRIGGKAIKVAIK